jgi:V/A-type H+-transporting ATPase subunit I
MLLPLEMKKALIGVHDSYLTKIIATLHEAAILEITNIWDSGSEAADILCEAKRNPKTELCVEVLQKITSILEALDEVCPDEPRHLKQLLFPRPHEKNPVRRRDFKDICTEIKEILQHADIALTLKRDIGEIRDRISALQAYRGSVARISQLNIDIGLLGESEFIYSVPVSISSADYEEIEKKILDTGIEELVITKTQHDDQYTVIITTLCENKAALHKILRNPAIRILEFEPSSGRAKDVIDGIDSEITHLETNEKDLINELWQINSQYGKSLRSLEEELSIEKERMQTRLYFGRTQNTFVIEGWVAEKDTGKLEQLCLESTNGHGFCIFRDPDAEKENVPIEYNNPSWLKPFEAVTTMFSRPKYGEIDPTVFTAPMLIAFFALMLGDAVYGLLIVILGVLLKSGLGKINRSISDISIILIVAGIATIVSGILQGGYMGDFLPRFFGIQPPFVLINALESPIEFLQIALIIGVIQINLGLVIAAYQNLRRKQVRFLIHDQLSWFILQPAGAILLFNFFGWASFDPALMMFAYGAGFSGVLLILSKQGPLGLFDLTGFLGDWLSYARLLALALATGGIAMTVNILSQMVAGDHPLLILAAVAVFVIGQTFNFVLQTLGAFIHSLRLQFVEFFGKFYVGGGKEFTPFSAKRKVTKLIGGEM